MEDSCEDNDFKAPEKNVENLHKNEIGKNMQISKMSNIEDMHERNEDKALSDNCINQKIESNLCEHMEKGADSSGVNSVEKCKAKVAIVKAKCVTDNKAEHVEEITETLKYRADAVSVRDKSIVKVNSKKDIKLVETDQFLRTGEKDRSVKNYGHGVNDIIVVDIGECPRTDEIRSVVKDECQGYKIMKVMDTGQCQMVINVSGNGQGHNRKDNIIKDGQGHEDTFTNTSEHLDSPKVEAFKVGKIRNLKNISNL